uniref:Uncharacterized protein TCIL3000_4_180 n=1 Tax=Trypanosoma congolense (strain IL3000) TaxID=1068625 RepID=G0UKN6_TRYCI|nr:unnamed protein product [Trypanosoma congolense IL3000]
MEAVIITIGGGTGVDTNWAAIRKILAGDIKEQIINFNIKGFTEATRNRVVQFIQNHENSFKREVIGRASKAAAPMAEWIKAVLEYSSVLQTMEPMQQELKKYEENLAKGNEKKQKYEDKLKKLEERVEGLKRKFGEKTAEAERLKDRAEKAQQLYTSAHDLLAKLASEHDRWVSQIKGIRENQHLLPKRCLLAAAFILYLGNATEDERRRALNIWKERLKEVDNFEFFTFMRPESMQLHYKAEGLPGDELSMDNAVVIQEQVTTPLIIDTSGQALSWLVNHLKGKGLSVEVCSASEDRFVSSLELALRFGKCFILTDVGGIEAFMYPLFRKELRTEGTKRVIQFGDRRTVDYADGFRLYLVTNSSDLYIPPDVLSYLTPINFSITQNGLEGQFLGATIQHEQPELEKEKLAVLQKEERLKMQLADLEESLLKSLAESKGSLLDNKTLIDSLNEIKTQAAEIGEALETSKKVQEEIDAKRNVYRPFAKTASEIFFTVKSLKGLSHMYQFSFSFFMGLFHETLKHHANDVCDTEAKIEELTKTFVRSVVSSVSTSLFKEHRTVFGIHLARSLHPEECTAAEWDFFLDRAIAPEAKKNEVQVPTWVLPDSRDLYRSFAVLFEDLLEKLHLYEADVWLQWMRSTNPEVSYPRFIDKLSRFQRLLVVKTLRADRLLAAVSRTACDILDVKSWGDNNTLSYLVSRTEANIPILLLTTTGADPSQELQVIAHQKVGRDRFYQLAMGGGQAEEAIRLLRQCAANGEWLFLKNLHLVIPWVASLQKELNILKPDPKFRLFLTSEAHDEFPSIFLSNCLKITFEAPPGVQQNLLHTYNDWDSNFYDAKGSLHTQLLFITASFHAILQERRSYVPQGWTKTYEMTSADLKSATDIVVQQANNDVDWEAIRGLMEDAIYGSRLESDYDTRVLKAYTSQFFNPDVLPTAKKQTNIFGKVRVPASGKHADCLQVISELPESDIPLIFSLPPNADRVVQLAKVRALTDDLQLLLEVRGESSMTREQWASKLTPILQAWEQLTQPHADLLQEKITVGRDLSPILGFMAAEVTSSLNLLTIVNEAMIDLGKVVEGRALLREDRRAEAATMISGEVPALWDSYYQGSSRILPWLQSLVYRATSIAKLWKVALNGDLLKSPLNISSMFRPHTFLHALRQETAHSLHEPLVTLRLVTSIGSPPEGNTVPVCLEGLMLQGAVLDESNMLQSIHAADEAALFSMPKTYVGWMTTVPQSITTVGVPLYTNGTKEMFLAELHLPCASEEDAKAFVLAGVALVLEP